MSRAGTSTPWDVTVTGLQSGRRFRCTVDSEEPWGAFSKQVAEVFLKTEGKLWLGEKDRELAYTEDTKMGDILKEVIGSGAKIPVHLWFEGSTSYGSTPAATPRTLGETRQASIRADAALKMAAEAAKRARATWEVTRGIAYPSKSRDTRTVRVAGIAFSRDIAFGDDELWGAFKARVASAFNMSTGSIAKDGHTLGYADTMPMKATGIGALDALNFIIPGSGFGLRDPGRRSEEETRKQAAGDATSYQQLLLSFEAARSASEAARTAVDHARAIAAARRDSVYPFPMRSMR